MQFACDNQLTSKEKYDAAVFYKKVFGYVPGIALELGLQNLGGPN